MSVGGVGLSGEGEYVTCPPQPLECFIAHGAKPSGTIRSNILEGNSRQLRLPQSEQGPVYCVRKAVVPALRSFCIQSEASECRESLLECGIGGIWHSTSCN